MFNKAWLSSMVFDKTDRRCMRFYYSMYGDGIGSLEVDILFHNGERSKIWKLSKDRGTNQWFEAQVGIDSRGMTYKCAIRLYKNNKI